MPTETEVKMGAWAGFAVPDLDGVVDGVTATTRATRTLLAVYYDTADLRLARWGVTLRHRTRVGGGTGTWTVKLPDGNDGPALVRRELSFEGSAAKMPAAAASLVMAFARTSPLAPVARLRTVRTGVNLLDGEGAVVAEVVDDEVSVLHAGRVAARFREVEVELGERPPPALAAAVVARLRAAGAGPPDTMPKVIRALGPRALAPPDVAPAPLGRNPSGAVFVRRAIAVAVERILRHDPGVRIGDDPEDVHQARVGTRRLRSDLRTFAPLIDEAWLSSLRDELRWLGGALGKVRDADVLTERLHAQAAGVPEIDGAGLAPIFLRLALERDEARHELLAVMAGARYLDLLDRLVAGAAAAPCRHIAEKRASATIPGLVAGPWGRLAKAVAALPRHPPDADLHRVRILAKRARYAAEAAAPLAGRKAAALATALAGLQTVLGDHQDAVVAEAWLRAGPSPTGPATNALIARQQAEAEMGRRQWRAAWAKASAPRLRTWL